jgi:hypothetical protein
MSRACQNPLKLIWFDGTFISYEQIPPIPNVNYFFKDFAEILSGDFHPDDIHGINYFSLIILYFNAYI